MARWVEAAPPLELDRELRAAIAFLQGVDLEMGRILKQVLDRRLYQELGFEDFERYVSERLDLSPRTARRLVRLARAEHRAPAVANAFRTGRITLLQAEVLLRTGAGSEAHAPDESDVKRAEALTLRGLEDRVPERGVRFWAPRPVAIAFRALVAEIGLERMLEHAIATWLLEGEEFRDYADFERDGWRCTVPACTARRNLHSHHLWFRSAQGPDEPWNRTTLCAFHHHRGVHGAPPARIRTEGHAPDHLRFELGVGTFYSGDWKDRKDPKAAAARRAAGDPPWAHGETDHCSDRR